MNKTFFYIIQRDGMIFEIESINNRFQVAMDQWQKGGLIIFPTLGAGINSVDIKNIFDTRQYENYLSTVKPKQYIKNGTWYDGKTNEILRHEKWRTDEIENVSKIEAQKDREISPEEKQRISDMARKVYESFKVKRF